MKCVRALQLARKIRRLSQFSGTLQSAVNYEHEAGIERGEIPATDDARKRDVVDDPSYQTLRRAQLRVDVTATLLDRREWARLAAEGDTLQSLHLYTDASPVTGVEIQGMRLDVFKYSGELKHYMMPGASLAYGFTGAADKVAAFLWSLWLMAGPGAHFHSVQLSKARPPPPPPPPPPPLSQGKIFGPSFGEAPVPLTVK